MAAQTHAGSSPHDARVGRHQRSVASRAAGKRSQRMRLLEAVTTLASGAGYAHVTVARIIALAGVSRPTFYEYFTDKEECFVAALAPIRSSLLAGIRRILASDRPERATLRAADALLAFAGSQPTMARLLLSDSLTGGRRMLESRDQLVADAAAIVEETQRRLPAGAVVPDLPPSLVCGVTCRLLASRLRGEAQLSDLVVELPGWLAAYELAIAEHRWQALAGLPPPDPSPFLSVGPLRAPPPLTGGARRSPERALAENHWLRIVFATAEVVRREGYAQATVAQITQAAGVDARVFYEMFASKQRAFAATGELAFRHAMARTAGAFVGEQWPRRVWEAARALTQCAEQNPTLAYVLLVDGGACWPASTPRVEEFVRAFTIFLQEGNRHAAGAESRPAWSELALEMIATAVFELGYQRARGDGGAPPSHLLAHVVFICLAPFLGSAGAHRMASLRR